MRTSADVCQEPNDTVASACFLGPQGPATGTLENAGDVDLYKVELPPDRMLQARLTPAGYELQLILPDGTARPEVAEAGPAERTLKVDGLPAGAYYLRIFAQGEADPNQTYEISVAFPPALALAAPGALGSQPTVTSGYVPPPASQYGLRLDELGPGFRESKREEPEGGRAFSVSYFAQDAKSFFGVPVSDSNVGAVFSDTTVFPYGSEDQVLELYENRLKNLREKQNAHVEPVVGWGSERAMTYTWRVDTRGLGPSPVWGRGILLKHQNAVADTFILGWEQFTTWDRIAQLAKKVEDRILAASK
jgi:hypothetical protein